MRYISLGKFIELLDSKSLHLSRIDRFEDKTEGEWFAHLVKSADKAIMLAQTNLKSMNQNENEYLPEDKNDANETNVLNEVSSLKKRSYISSWFSSDYLSIAMWKLYGITDEGIAIRVKKDKIEAIEELNKEYLKELGAEVLNSTVIYVDDDAEEMCKLINNNISNEKWLKFRNILLKHKAYKFEEEYRMAVILPDNNKDFPLGLKLELGDNLNDFIDSIFLNPLIHSNHWYIKVVQAILVNFGIDADKLKLGEIKTNLN